MFYISLMAISLMLTTSLSAGVATVSSHSSIQVHKGNYLLAKVQDNGQSCVYNKRYRAVVVTCEGCDSSDKPYPSTYGDTVPLKEDVLDTSEYPISLITARSIAVDDVMATLQKRYDNAREHQDLFELTQGTLAGKYAIYQGTHRYYNLMTLIGEPPHIQNEICLLLTRPRVPCPKPRKPEHGEQEKTGTPLLEVIAEVAKETHSSGSVSCPYNF